MSKLKKKKDDNKLSNIGGKARCFIQRERDVILFSFKYITNQDRYSLEQFKKSSKLRDDMKVLNAFHERIAIMSAEGWRGLEKRDKFQGGKELLEYSQLRFNAYDPNNELQLSNDSKVMSIRFGGNKYRLLGYRDGLCSSIFYVLGIDIDFSAYNHGS